MAIYRGEIYFVELGPTEGKELDDKSRPVVVLSINSLNSKPLVVTVIPGTTYRAGKRVFPTEVVVDPTTENGLTSATLFQCFQIRAIDHGRFDAPPIGEVAVDDILRIEQAVKFCLGLP